MEPSHSTQALRVGTQSSHRRHPYPAQRSRRYASESIHGAPHTARVCESAKGSLQAQVLTTLGDKTETQGRVISATAQPHSVLTLFDGMQPAHVWRQIPIHAARRLRTPMPSLHDGVPEVFTLKQSPIHIDWKAGTAPPRKGRPLPVAESGIRGISPIYRRNRTIGIGKPTLGMFWISQPDALIYHLGERIYWSRGGSCHVTGE